MDPEDLRARLSFDDARLLAECEVDQIAAVGRGGQKRNRTHSTVRLRHRPSGLVSVGRDSRQKSANIKRALRRLREAIAIAGRVALPEQPSWPDGVHVKDRRLRVAPRNPARPEVLALLLDALEEHDGRASEAAAALGLSTSSFVRTLAGHNGAFAEANRMRKEAGLTPLRQG